MAKVVGEQAEVVTKFPLTIRWDAEALVAVISGQWTRQDGQIVATYNNIDEVRLALELTQVAQAMAANAPPKITSAKPRS